MKTKLLSLFFLISLSAFAQLEIPSYVPQNGLLAYFPFDGNTNDMSGNQNNGYITGSVTLVEGRTGKPNTAYSFSGVNSYIGAVVNKIPSGNSSRTISGWFKTDNAFSDQSKSEICIFNYGTLSKTERLALTIYSKGYLQTVSSSDFSNDDFYINNFDYSNNDWYFYTLTYNGNKASLYINGEFVSEKAMSLNTVNSTFKIGQRVAGDDRDEAFKGTIDDIGIWNRVLTQDEISSLYNFGAVKMYTLIPDSNFEQKLIDSGIDSGIIDGKVLTSNIKSVTFLNLTKSNISDLTGIQDFVSLTDLYCGQNSLTTLNVSKNTALTTLDCNNNKITSLNVSNNTALLNLSCYSNQLTSLNVKANTALTKLDSGSNQYTALDVSSNTGLTFLGCNTSQLTSLDVSKNTALTLLDCRENKITTLDVSKLTALTELYCQSNQLKDLDVSKNKSLELINCSKNRLTTLDLSTHSAAIGLYANSNQLTSLNLKNGNNANFQLLYLNLTNNPNLSCIQVDDKVYSDANWSTKKDATANYNTTCTSYYTEIPDSNFEKKLIDLGIDTDGLNGKVTIADIEKVTYLDLSNSNISDLSGIEKFTALTYLDCNYNNLSTIDVSKNKLLTKLSLHDNKLTSLDVTQNLELFNLTFSMNQISTIDLSKNKKLHYVTADRNKLSNIDLTANPEIEILYCGSNNLTTLNVSNLPNLLQLNCTYTTISAIDVTSNPKLEMLYFNDSKLTTLDLSKNPLLKNLNVSNNELTTLDLSHNPLLEIVFIEFNPLTSLNVQNGNNKNFIIPSETGKKSSTGIFTSFLNNSKLSCIQVDNVEFSNTNWSKIKDVTATYSSTCKSLGLENSVFDKIVIYPNPTKGEVTIKNASLEKATVYNSLGQLVRTFNLDLSNTINSINLSGLPTGIYYIYLINQDAASAKKVIVE